MRRIREALWLLRHGFVREVLRAVRIRAYSRTVSLGVQRELRAPVYIPPARVPLDVRPLRPDDDLSLLAVHDGEHGSDVPIRVALRRLVDAGVPTCWIAQEPGRPPCYVQWMLTRADSRHIDQQWPGLFPPLEEGEWLSEGAYTSLARRGRAVMPHAAARVVAAARDAGARRVIGFVQRDNTPSLKVCRMLGFTPYLERTERWTLFRRRITFRRLAEGTPYPFERALERRPARTHLRPAFEGAIQPA